MDQKKRPELTPIQHHHRQSALQIWLPAIFISIIFLALCVLAVSLTFSDQPLGKNLASVSVLWWILPSCLGGLIPLALLAGSVFAAGKAIHGLPGLAGKLKNVVDQLSVKVKSFSDKLAKPVIKAYGWQAAAKKGWDSTAKNEQVVKDGGLDGTTR